MEHPEGTHTFSDPCDFCGMDDLPTASVWDRFPDTGLTRKQVKEMRLKEYGDYITRCWKKACPFCAELGLLTERFMHYPQRKPSSAITSTPHAPLYRSSVDFEKYTEVKPT